MMERDLPGARGGAWLVVDDDDRITYRIDRGGEDVDFVVFGSMELCLGMSTEIVRRCRDLFDEALAEMHRVQQPEGEE